MDLYSYYQQEAQLMLTNLRDAFRASQDHQTWYHCNSVSRPTYIFIWCV